MSWNGYQPVKQQTKELQDGMSVVEQHEQEGDPQDWNLSDTLIGFQKSSSMRYCWGWRMD